MKKAHNSGKMAYKKADGITVGFLLFLNFCCAGVDRAEKVHITVIAMSLLDDRSTMNLKPMLLKYPSSVTHPTRKGKRKTSNALRLIASNR